MIIICNLLYQPFVLCMCVCVCVVDDKLRTYLSLVDRSIISSSLPTIVSFETRKFNTLIVCLFVIHYEEKNAHSTDYNFRN